MFLLAVTTIDNQLSISRLLNKSGEGALCSFPFVLIRRKIL
nr:MAG TPA: hypothetical protein [Caudoviricetes sp.]